MELRNIVIKVKKQILSLISMIACGMLAHGHDNIESEIEYSCKSVLLPSNAWGMEFTLKNRSGKSLFIDTRKLPWSNHSFNELQVFFYEDNANSHNPELAERWMHYENSIPNVMEFHPGEKISGIWPGSSLYPKTIIYSNKNNLHVLWSCRLKFYPKEAVGFSKDGKPMFINTKNNALISTRIGGFLTIIGNR